MNYQPFVSVIVPVHNGGEYIERCLSALMVSHYPSFEIIVVDDGSTDDSISFAHRKGVIVLQLQVQSGVSFARNFGAKHARGDILLFIDSDVIVRCETIALVVASFLENPDCVAVFGSYDDDPEEGNFISQYRNLFHHFQHQHASAEAFTFWAGCGAVQKKVFEEMGGFDQKRYKKPSIEDIELGFRIGKKGYKILLDRNLQVKHLKRWGLISMLRTDIFQRAVPWSRLILGTKFMPKDLNLKITDKISALLVALMVLLIPVQFFIHITYNNMPVIEVLLLLLFINVLFLNRKLYIFYARRRGIIFMLRVIPLHLLYYLYSSMSFFYSWVTHKISILSY